MFYESFAVEGCSTAGGGGGGRYGEGLCIEGLCIDRGFLEDMAWLMQCLNAYIWKF